jgi:thioredoxin reductase
LGLPNEDLPKVTYNLIEPEQYQNQDIVVVGGGNAGIEAAQALGNRSLRNKVTILIRGPQLDRCNEENQKMIESMAKRKEVVLCFNASVNEIHADRLVIQVHGQKKIIANNYLFVFAGAELPSKMLASLGIQMDKKFGEGLSKSP